MVALRHPLPGATMTPGRGFTGPLPGHTGVDLSYGGGSCGREVLAAGGGWARRAVNGGGGLGIVIDHGDGTETGYWHLSRQLVTPGPPRRVEAGQKVGLVGATGTSVRGCHLHFELKEGGKLKDPAPVLQAGGVVTAPSSGADSYPRDPGTACAPGYLPGTINPQAHGWLPGSPWWNRPTNTDGTVNACIREGLAPGDNTAMTDAGQAVGEALTAVVPIAVNLGVVGVALLAGWAGIKQVLNIK